MTFIKCFHGTTLEIAKEIISKNEFIITHKSYHWLGPGAYFFQDAPFRAWAWAVNLCQRSPSKKPAVLVFDIDMKGCLDFLDMMNWPLMEESYNEYARIVGVKAKHQERPIISRHDGKKFAFFSEKEFEGDFGRNYLDNDVIKFAIKKHEDQSGKKINSVRAAFIEGKELYKNSFFYNHYHIQFAIVNDEVANFGRPNSILKNPKLLTSDHLDAAYQNSKIKWP